MFATIINIIDIALIVISFALSIKTVFFAKEVKYFALNKADRQEYLRGAAYGFRLALLDTVYRNGIRWPVVILGAVIIAAIWFIGLHFYAVYSVAIYAMIPVLTLVPEPKLSAMDKLQLNLQVSLRNF